MKIKCCSIRFDEIDEYNNERPYVSILLFNGEKVFISRDHLIAYDLEVVKCYAIWIPYWVAYKKGLSTKKAAWFEDGKMLTRYKVETFIPEKIAPINSTADSSLLR